MGPHESLLRAIQRGVTRLTVLPSQLAPLLRSVRKHFAAKAAQTSLLVVASGEPLYASVVRAFYEIFPNSSLINLYGSTEVSGDVTFYVTNAKDGEWIDSDSFHKGSVPIGNIISGNVMRVCGGGHTGELLIAGKHVAMGTHPNFYFVPQIRYLSHVCIFLFCIYRVP